MADHMRMHGMIELIVGRLLIHRSDPLLVMFVRVVNQHFRGRIGLAGFGAVGMRNGRTHAPMGQEHDAEHQGGEPLPHGRRLTPRADTNNRDLPTISHYWRVAVAMLDRSVAGSIGTPASFRSE